MEISDLTKIGKIKCSKNDELEKKLYLHIDEDYKSFLPKLKNIFLIYKDHRVRYGKIIDLKMIDDTKAVVNFDDDDVKAELEKEFQVTVMIDDEEFVQLDEENQYFNPIGMKVIWNEKEVATIKDFFYNGAHDVYEIEMDDKKIVLIPDVENFVTETNTVERYIKVINLDQFLEI